MRPLRDPAASRCASANLNPDSYTYEITLSGALPGATATLYTGTRVANPGPCLPLSNPLTSLGTVTVDATGRASIRMFLPDSLACSETSYNATGLQWVILDSGAPGGIALTPRLDIRRL